MLAFWNCSNKSAGAWMWLNYMLLSWMGFFHSLSHGKNLGPVVRTVDNAVIHRINLYPVDKAVDFPNTYPPNSDISGEWRYPTFEQPEPWFLIECQTWHLLPPNIWSLTAVKANWHANGKLYVCFWSARCAHLSFLSTFSHISRLETAHLPPEIILNV